MCLDWVRLKGFEPSELLQWPCTLNHYVHALYQGDIQLHKTEVKLHHTGSKAPCEDTKMDEVHVAWSLDCYPQY